MFFCPKNSFYNYKRHYSSTLYSVASQKPKVCGKFGSIICSKMVKQKIVLKLSLEDDSRRRKAFQAAVSMAGVTSVSLEGDKIVVVGNGVDSIALTTALRRRLGYAELLAVSSGDEKAKAISESKGGHQTMVVPSYSYPAYYQYNAVPSYHAYSYPYQQEATQDPNCSIT